jgi:hypothetical protein
MLLLQEVAYVMLTRPSRPWTSEVKGDCKSHLKPSLMLLLLLLLPFCWDSPACLGCHLA